MTWVVSTSLSKGFTTFIFCGEIGMFSSALDLSSSNQENHGTYSDNKVNLNRVVSPDCYFTVWGVCASTKKDLNFGLLPNIQY